MAGNKGRPVIGVTGPDRRGWVLWAFNRLAVTRSGGRAVAITPGRPADPGRLDGLIVAGGADVDPTLYGQPNVASRNLDPARDSLEGELLSWAFRHRKPLLAVCRGAQLLNVTLGGTLHQDASRVYPGFRPTAGLYNKLTLRRPIHVIKRGWVSSLLGTGTKAHLVNSLHHQAIAELAPELEAVAVDGQGMVQAIEPVRKDFFAVGVQWHPELMLRSRAQTSFFRALVAACRGELPPPA